MVHKAQVLDEKAMQRTIKRLAHEILERNKGAENIVFVGILTRGKPLAEMLAESVNEIENISLPVGKIDISGHRDDGKVEFSQIQTDIPFEIEGKTVILVDDVLFTGRSVRAALDALIDIARPKAIQLAVLVDRGHRELPIRADYVGKNVPTSTKEIVKVSVRGYDEVNSVDILARL